MSLLFECETKIPSEIDFDMEKIAKNVVEAACDASGFPYEYQVSVTLTDEEGIQTINNEFRNIDKVTDVLSFPLLPVETPGDFAFLDEVDDCFDMETGEAVLGDIVICVPRMMEQAVEYGHSAKREYAFLIAHSMYHLFGYDHMTESEAKVMEDLQEKVLLSLGITRE